MKITSLKRQLKQIKQKKTQKKRKQINSIKEGKTQPEPQRQSIQMANLLSKFLGKNKYNKIKEAFVNYYGKNFSIQYKNEYDFQEEWQNKNSFQFSKLKKLVDEQNSIEVIMLILTVVTYTLTIWFSTVDTYFARQTHIIESEVSVYFTIIVHLTRSILQIRKQIHHEKSQTKILPTLYRNKKQIIVLLYLLMKMFENEIQISSLRIYKIFEIISLFWMYLTARKIYQSIKYLNFPLRYEYQTKIVDLIVTIFVIAHVISIFLIQTSRLNPQNNWMSHLNIPDNDHWTRYIYTYYFTITTILTVGYGDITPKNPQEVIVVVLIQIFGIVIFGFVLSQIGYCISSLKKSRQVIDKDLAIIQKIKRQYMTNSSSINKMVSFIINNKETNDKLTPQEQKNVLMKLNDEFRQNIVKQNFSNIVKNSVFFLCRWSKYFQNSISMKLNHVLYNPNDLLSETKNKQKIYIIKSGKINIHADRSSGKKKMGTLLKTIQNSKQNFTLHNCFGYTAVISDKPFNLYAISKDFTSVYYVEKSDFIECVKQKECDFQYYHQIKSKLDLSTHIQAFQAELLLSNRYHYNPSRTFLLKKFNKTKVDCKRKHYNRTSKRIPGGKYFYQQELAGQIREVFSQTDKQIQLDVKDTCKQQTIHQSKLFKKLKRSSSIQKCILNKNSTTNSNTNIFQNSTLEKLDFQVDFEQSKQYQNYYSRKNVEKVLKKYENQFLSNRMKSKKK